MASLRLLQVEGGGFIALGLVHLALNNLLLSTVGVMLGIIVISIDALFFNKAKEEKSAREKEASG